MTDPAIPPPPGPLPDVRIDAPPADSPEWSERIVVEPGPAPVGELTPPIALVLVPEPPPEPLDGASRLAWLWANARYLASRAVQIAEELHILPDGAARRAAAVGFLRKLLAELRERADGLLSPRVLAVIFLALDTAAPVLVERAFRELERLARGLES
jgi:hypothetical protein